MKTIITWLSLAGMVAVAVACSSPEALQNDANLQTPNLQVPVGGITPVRDVVVTPRENDMIEFTAAANGTFKFEQLTAVMWCRASQHAKANKFPEWQPLKSEQLRPASVDAPMIGRGLVQMVKNPAPQPGKKQPVKDWCKDVPKVAVS
ncbi:MAG: hypothetical protein SGJ17_11310 [Hyphomicrobiales bacterium]|nr:hypothetical protein [Hyphomicrobiales bacterium]